MALPSSRIPHEAAARVLGLVRAAPEALRARAETPYAVVDAQVQNRLYRELHRYPRKNRTVTRLLWLVTGFAGGHRYYLGQIGKAVLMTLTGGGLLIWWLIDGFYVARMVDAYNDEQGRREAADDPPIGMDFVPKVAPDVLGEFPAWHNPPAGRRRMRKALGLVADAGMLSMFGYILGRFTVETGVWSAALAVFALVVMINFAEGLVMRLHLPLVREMIRWDYKLRLFYHFNKPGRALALLFRGALGLLYAPFSRKNRTEVKLYLEVAGLFTVVAVLYKLITGYYFSFLTDFDIEPLFDNWVKGMLLGFIAAYLFAAPIGATLMKHTLLRRPNYVRWGLSAVALGFLLVGLF